MPFYRLRFTKTVFNDTGHARTICQRLLEVEARDPDQAVAQGQILFCSLERIPSWWLRADGFEVQPVADSARGQASAPRLRETAQAVFPPPLQGLSRIA